MKGSSILYTPIVNQKDTNAIRLRHLKYINTINHNLTDLRLKRMVKRNSIGLKKSLFSLKVAKKLEITHSHSNQSIELRHLFRFAKDLKKVSFLQVNDPFFVKSEDHKTKGLLLTLAKNLRFLNFSYEIQDQNFANYERFYDTILTLNGNAPNKCSSQAMSENIIFMLQNLDVVLPRDTVFVVDFRVSNEILDNPPVNRLTHDNESYIWNLAASYFTLSDIQNSFAYKFESLLNIRKVFFSGDSSNSTFDYFRDFLNKLQHIETLHLQLKKSVSTQILYFKDFTTLVTKDMNLKSLIIECEDIDLDPVELIYNDFPQELTSLQLNLKNTRITHLENIYYIEKFPIKLKSLNKLKILKLAFPTTFLMNQMIHNMPENLRDMELLEIDFPESRQIPEDEDIYLNSLLEVVCTMPKLKEFYVKSNRLNYTYCAYLAKENIPSGLKRLQFIDDSLLCEAGQKELQTKQWIECKKFEDLNIILRLLTEDLEYLQIPFVFDGLESEFVALRFLEVLSGLKNLKNLKLSLGFKTLDESHVEAIQKFVVKVKETFIHMKSFRMNLDIYYRKIKGAFSIDELNYLNNKKSSRNNISTRFLHDIYS